METGTPETQQRPARRRAPSTGPSQNDLLLEFAEDELAAARRVAAAEAVVTAFFVAAGTSYSPELETAIFELVFSTEDFYRARLSRFMPEQADLIEWVFYQETREQAALAAREGA